MRCGEAKRRLIEGAPIEGDLAGHFRSCDSCAAYLDADESLRNILRIVRDEGSAVATPFTEILENVESKFNERKGISLMSKMKSQIENHKKVGFSLLAAACLFALVVLVPFSYDQTVGYTVTIPGLDPAQFAIEGSLPQALASVGLEAATVDFVRNSNLVDFTIGNLPSKNSAREAAAVFSSLCGYDGPFEIAPVTRKTSASLYAQVRDKLTRIEVDAKGKTDAEVKAEIESKLRAQGYANPQVSVETKADGMRQIDVGLTDSSGTRATKRKMEIAVPGDNISFDASHEVTVDTKGKTDDQIKEEVRKKLVEQGLENPEITVKTDKDGKRNIEIEVKKEKEDR